MTSTAATAASSVTAGPASTATPVTVAPVTVAAMGFPAGKDLEIAFTYAPSSGGTARNPYVAVWVEDASGNLVKTVSLWFEQSGKGSRWLNDLRSWVSASGGVIDQATTGATRGAGAYTVAWDGTDANGALVPAGDYTVFVEAAREHGPHGITSATMTVDGGGFTLTLPDQGELRALSASLAV